MIQYFITNGVEEKEVSGIGKTGLKLQLVRDNAQKFMRPKITGNLNLTGELYQFAYPVLNSCCSSLTLIVRSDGSQIVKSSLLPFNADFDEGTCTIGVSTFVAIDPYSVVLANYDKEVNLLYINELVEYYCTNLPDNLQKQSRGRYFIKMLDYLLRITFEKTAGETLARPDGTGYSQFYENENNPVTGIVNPLKGAVLTHLSDVVLPSASNPATVGIMKLKDLLETLRIRHNVYWDIDEHGYFRLEHRQFYDLGGRYTIPTLDEVVDLSSYGSPKTYKYVQEDLYGSEVIENTLNDGLQKNRKHIPGYNDLAWPDWLTGGVRYENCIPADENGEAKVLTLTDPWVSDYRLAVIDAGESVSRQGWVFVEVETVNNRLQVRRTQGRKSGAILENGGQSPANLFVSYHRWGRSYPSGIVNEKTPNFGGNTLAMRFVNPNKQWGAIIVPACNIQSLRFNKPVKVAFSSEIAFVQSVDWDFEKEQLAIVVRTGGLCYQDPSQWPDIEANPNNICPPPGELISRVQTGGFEGGNIFSAGRAYILFTDTFTDGNCGTTVLTTKIYPS